MNQSIVYETPADGFGDNATDDDRQSFCEYVEGRVEAAYPGYDCYASFGKGTLESKVAVHSGGGTSVAGPDAHELKTWIGTVLWDEWCTGIEEAS
jgi:hypothetical protein